MVTSKPPRVDTYPDIITALKSIGAEVGKHDTKVKQEKFLARLFKPEHRQGLGEKGVADKAERYRKNLRQLIRAHPSSDSEELFAQPSVKVDEMRILFMEGPQYAFNLFWLLTKGWRLKGSEKAVREQVEKAVKQAARAEKAAKQATQAAKTSSTQARSSLKVVLHIPSLARALQPQTNADGHQEQAGSDKAGKKRRTPEGDLSEADPEPKRSKPDQSADDDEQRQDTHSSESATSLAAGSQQSPSFAADAGGPAQPLVVDSPFQRAKIPAERTPKDISAGPSSAPVRPQAFKFIPINPMVPVEDYSIYDANSVARDMESLASKLWDVMIALLGERGIDGTAQTTFVYDSKDLDNLWTTLFGHEIWEEVVSRVFESGEPDCLRQDFTLFGLLGAGVFRSVFQRDLPWDDLANCLGDNVKFLDQAVSPWGYGLEGLTKNFLTAQIEDREFQEQRVRPHARKLAAQFRSIMSPHFEEMAKSRTNRPEDSNPLRSDDSKSILEEAFFRAILIKQYLAGSQLGEYSFDWPSAGDKIQHTKHQQKYQLAGYDRILHCVLPGISIKRRAGTFVYSRAIVIPASAKMTLPRTSEG